MRLPFHLIPLPVVFMVGLPAFAGLPPGKAASAASEAATKLVWPPPPAEPRVAYIRSINTPADLGVKRSLGRRLSSFLFGTQSAREKLSRPFGIALDESNNLCLTDTASATVCFFDQAKKSWESWEKIGPVRLLSPVAVAKRNDTFFVADSELGVVLAFRGKAELLCQITNGLMRPCGLAIAGDKLFVVDSKAHAVFSFNLQGKPLSTFGGRGVGPGQMNFPSHISAAPDGRLLITDSMNCRIQIFTIEGKYVSSLGQLGDASGHLSRPKGVAVDSRGHIYVIDALFDNLQMFDSSGRFLLAIGNSGAQPGQFWMPNGIAIGSTQQIFVTDSYNQRVQIFQYLDKP